MNENLGELAGRQDKLGNEVDVVVAVTSQVELGGRGRVAELLVQLRIVSLIVIAMLPKAHLSKVERRALATVVVVTVHVEDLLAVDRQEARDNALGQAGALYAVVRRTLWNTPC